MGKPKQLHFRLDGHQFISPWFYGDVCFQKFLKVCFCIEPGVNRYAGVCGFDIIDAYQIVAELERHIKAKEGVECASIQIWDVTEKVVEINPQPIDLCSHCHEGHILVHKEIYE